MSANIRVLLLEMPQLLRDILESVLASAGDVELLHEPASSHAAVLVPRRPDAVVIGTPTGAGPRAVALLQKWPTTHVIAVEPAGRDVRVYELRPHVTQLGQLSPPELVEVIREAVRRREVRDS